MSDSLLDKYLTEFNAQNIPARTYESRKWFFSMVKSGELDATGKELIRDSMTTRRMFPKVGKLYTFNYSAKHKDTLPYWDRYPLIMLVDLYKGKKGERGFYGLNLHYLNSFDRAVLLDTLQKRLMIKSGDDLNENTRLKISYDILNSKTSFRKFRPTFKLYLSQYVRGRIAEIPAQYWEVSVFLPTQKFVGAIDKFVWSESKKQLQLQSQIKQTKIQPNK